MYEKLIKPILFKQDPEKTHDRALKLGQFFGNFSLSKKILGKIYTYKNEKLNLEIKGIKFENPVGLSAGFDKNGVLTEIIPSVGFGFMEVGSVTARKCLGNPKPRLFRVPEDEGIIVNYGLCNDGAEAVFNKLKNKKFRFPIGISIAKTNDASIKGDDSVEEYFKAYEILKNIGDYMTINISCPNVGDGRSFEDTKLLEKLLKKIGKKHKLLFLKVSPEINKKDLSKIIKLSEEYNLNFVVSNLTKDRKLMKTKINADGGLSGKLTKEKADELIKYIYKKTKGKKIIIGVGGIFSAEDAYKKIRNGASLVQLITGMIYRGPGIVKEINKGLVKLLGRDGFENIKDVIGIDVHLSKWYKLCKKTLLSSWT